MVGDIAHVFNRGVEKRNIFLNRKDYLRFVENLFLLNNKEGKIRTRQGNTLGHNDLKRKKLVEIFKWSLLPNHYHLLIYELEEGGILEFTKRLGNAYTKYFNTKNGKRSGYLFQNSAKIVRMTDDSQFIYAPVYIDINPLDLKFPKWKSSSINTDKALDFLSNYEWSSFKDFYGSGMHSAVVNKELFYEMFDTNEKKYQKELIKFLDNPTVSTWQVDTVGNGN
ncbi:MAG: Transposase [Parcubacteria bacterium C7867-005]|nr:MAG: Transposase [Parcubacteria bacterium C7867-005]